MAKTKKQNKTAAILGFEKQLWQTADALRDTLLPRLLSGEVSACNLQQESGLP